MEVDVLIPVYRPDGKLTELLKRLKMQNYPIHRVILMNTEEKHFPTELTGIWDRVEVYHLAKEEFDHGGTRDRGVRMSTADLVVCMTQDLGSLCKTASERGLQRGGKIHQKL